ncbi:MAG: hypothetical protein GY910_04995 [bacterium]|nr:hypothetical protein [Deltaproteobacteria bacterium]MCP4904319.1 hypothetical protein [bacterium]
MLRCPLIAWVTVSTLLLSTACTTRSEPIGLAPPAAADPYQALERLAGELEAAVDIAREEEASSVPFGRGEGALHILRLLRRAIDEELAWADTEHPYFQAQDERYAKVALGNPDNLYLVSRVEDDAVYRIKGRRGTTADFSIQLYQGYPGIHRPMRARGTFGLSELITDDEGRFEVIVGGPPREGNWIELAPRTRRILVRYTYGDWASEEAGEIGIERVGMRGRVSRAVEDEIVAARIDATAAYLGDALTGYLGLVDQVFSGLEMNRFRPLRRMTGADGGLESQYSVAGRYRLRDDQALLVTLLPSDARYQGFQLGTEWFEGLDFVNQLTSLNNRQARLSPDGVYRFVISMRDPGVANWLDASGAPQGQMMLRWQGVGALTRAHEPKVELLPFDSIASHFPSDEPSFDAAARRVQIAERQEAIERRYGLARR